MEFFLNVFTKFSEFSDKNICHYSKRARTCHPATSCVRDQDATTASARHMWETGSLNQAQFMLQWLSDSLNLLNSVKVLLHLGKTPMNGVPWMWHFAAKNRMKRRILEERGCKTAFGPPVCFVQKIGVKSTVVFKCLNMIMKLQICHIYVQILCEYW